MTAIVRIALQRPYTFVVMALLLLIAGTLAALRTPADILPEIRIPVISVAWQYGGLPPEEIAGRISTPFQRTLTTTVNDVAHIEANSFTGVGLIKVYFHPDVDIAVANAQVTAIAQSFTRQGPPGITPPLILNYNASTVPILQIALSGRGLTEQALGDLAMTVVRTRLVTVPGAAMPLPFGGKGRQVQIDLDPAALQARGLSAQDVANALAAQNLILPIGTQKIGDLEYAVHMNSAPSAITELANLPIKAVNGTVIYLRDVAQVRDGSPPQMNIVRVDGGRSVLMSVLKNGAISTLDIVSGVKARLRELKASLPDNLEVRTLNDQSLFVRAAIRSVVIEGVIAAALTSLMILLFLGSLRSTAIIAISIPLSVLGAIFALAVTGETLNIMTLGGLALAVGILVDDATVTVENINWHLDQGKGVRQSILDGAAQIVAPAFVSLLAICIVFVPMFFLEGVPGFLFVPLAKAVVFAMVTSFVLSRTLVPTMAAYMLQPHGSRSAGKSAFSLVQQRFERAFERLRGAYREVLVLAMQCRASLLGGSLAVVLLSSLLLPFLGRNFFPDVDGGQILMHVRAPVGTRVEETAAHFARIEQVVRGIIPPAELETLVANIGMPISSINLTYNSTGLIGEQDGDIQIALARGHAPSAGYVRLLRERLPQAFPGSTFSFPPADIVSQILNFGSPSPIDVRVIGGTLEQGFAHAGKLLERIRRVPGVADARIQQSRRAGGAHVVAESRQRRVVSDGDAGPAVPARLARGACQPFRERRRQRDAADAGRSGELPPVTGQRGGQPVRQPDAGADQGECSGPGSGRSRDRYPPHPRRGHRRRSSQGHASRAGRTGEHHGQRFLRAALWFAWRYCPDLPAGGGELPVVARSAGDHRHPAGGARGHRVDAVRHPHAAVGAGAHRRHHVHGYRHGQQRAGHQLRAVLATRAW